MLYDDFFKHPKDVSIILKKMEELTSITDPIRLMEICGTHTMAIARSGIKSILPQSIQLISGPGCPVCVTPTNIIDMVLGLSKRPNVLIASYGELLRVPGATQADNLLRRKAAGSKVEAV